RRRDIRRLRPPSGRDQGGAQGSARCRAGPRHCRRATASLHAAARPLRRVLSLLQRSRHRRHCSCLRGRRGSDRRRQFGEARSSHPLRWPSRRAPHCRAVDDRADDPRTGEARRLRGLPRRWQHHPMGLCAAQGTRVRRTCRRGCRMIRGEALLARLGDRLEGIRGRITPNAEMDKITWFRAGGPAEALYQPADEDDLAAFLKAVPEDVPVTVVGIGSNLLVREGGIPGFVIRLSAKGFGEAEVVSPTKIRAGAATPDKRVAALAYEAGIGGFHFYHGIPGGIGGALRMTAGANAVETRERVVEVRALDRKGEVHTLSTAGMGYASRHSSAPAHLIFTSAVFE